MTERRAAQARQRPGMLAACLWAWGAGEDSIDARAAALVVAEAIVLWRERAIKGQ